jgi:formylmethanofuran dehydrogenase subunit D
MPSLEVVLLTGRTRRQGVGLELGKLSETYQESTTRIRLDAKDLEKVGVKPEENVTVKTDYGSVVLRAVIASRSRPGIAFVPYGPWSNLLIGGGTDSTGMPSSKGLKAVITPAPDKKVLTLPELLAEQRAAGKAASPKSRRT